MVEIEKLTKDDVPSRTNTFKIVVKCADYETAMNPEVWPYRVGVRHFKPPRMSRQGPSWQDQVKQGGGQVGQQHGRHGPQPKGQPRPPPQQVQPEFHIDLQNRYWVLAGYNGDGAYPN